MIRKPYGNYEGNIYNKYPKDYDDITKKITKNNSMILDYLYRISQIEKNS